MTTQICGGLERLVPAQTVSLSAAVAGGRIGRSEIAADGAADGTIPGLHIMLPTAVVAAQQRDLCTCAVQRSAEDDTI